MPCRIVLILLFISTEIVCNKYKEAQFKLSIPGEELSDEPIDKETINNCFELGLIPESRPEIKKYPHMALIGYGESKSNVRWLCAGTLISERYILTAAHCVRSANVRPAKWIRLGESNYKTSSENNVGLMDFGIAAQITHPNYSIRIVYNDIALIKLDRNVPFSAYTRPLCLDTSSRPIESKAVAISWDLANEEYRENVHLLEMNLPLIPISRCKEILGNSSRYPTGIDEKSQICTNYQFNDENIWSDSDGPLQLRLNSEPCMHIQIGISSFGNAFYRLNEIPVVYTKVYNYLDWIQNIVWPQ